MSNLGCRSGLHNKTGPLLLKEMRVTVRFRFWSNAPDRVCVAGSIENFLGGGFMHDEPGTRTHDEGHYYCWFSHHQYSSVEGKPD